MDDLPYPNFLKVLTNKELEYLYWRCQGKLHKEIAEIMVITPGTVNKYSKRVFRKLEVPMGRIDDKDKKSIYLRDWI